MGEPRRYNILGTLGKGGFGTVYKAQLQGSAGFTKIVALKVLNAEVAGKEEFARRARDEARVLGLVRHRAIVQVDGLVVLQGHWVVVMEYVSGVDLKRLMQAGPVPPGVALEIIEEVAQALDAAYRQPGPEGKPLGLLHRDIKPSNLRITERGEVKVLDFGTARANFQSREAQTQALTFGTVGYMAPERMDFEDLPAGDVYALGVVLYELLIGEELGRTSPRADRHAALLTKATAKMREKAVAEPLITFVLHLLAYEPTDRPPIADVDNVCRALRGPLGAPYLADWAEALIPRLMLTDQKTKLDGMTGVSLTEQSGYTSVVIDPESALAKAPPIPEAPGKITVAFGRPRSVVLPLLVAFIAVGAFCGMGSVLAWLLLDPMSPLNRR